MAKDESQKTQGGDWRQAYSERRFGVLLVIVAVLLAGPPVLFGFGLSGAWFDGLMALLLVAAILSLCFEHRQRLFALLLGIPTILLSVRLDPDIRQHPRRCLRLPVPGAGLGRSVFND